ncbi:hypothetical protein TGARI_214385 [Toxoplasma gondii ARI]|uniref:Uncharacterized protein n=1 Tax=Toxoplasma gondii ARI TaxID=1074872 RepID=A0A139XVX1_TOXGO|nr:hypothetical protein TGARI_214385 [Toxoplasma gondii ARI]
MLDKDAGSATFGIPNQAPAFLLASHTSRLSTTTLKKRQRNFIGKETSTVKG